MKYTPRELIIFIGSLVIILANIYNIIAGATTTGFYLSVFIILMFGIVVAWTLKNASKTEN
ncbi:hypothetical protein [Methanogenium cariaci]|jgi:hypothetical protein|uniref:hypothetical protein n=1 Tax=Methanogenium cariaci TaxID=2197 RepID=UPI0007803C3C|nr:hypothetical protein [Methanogenium cariaci]